VKKRVLAIAERAGGVLPEGTGAVGAGLVVSSITAYAFVVISLNALEGDSKSAFSAFWAVIFVAGPGFFLPLEQEVGRALAHRRAQGLGGRPLVKRAATIGAIITAVLVVAAIVAAPVLSKEIYHGDQLFTLALCVSLVSFFLLHLTRGVLAGQGRFVPYGELLAIDGVIRLVMAIGLMVAGVHTAGLYALCLGLSPLVALPIVLRGSRRTLADGPTAPYSELSANLGWLLAASVFTQALAYAPLLGVNILATDAEQAIVTGFASAFFVARVPVLAFQAVQGTLLPKLAGLAGAGRHDEFRRGLNRLLGIVVGIAVLGTVGAFVAGPFVGKILFKDFTMSAANLALLAAGSGVFIIALTLAQALMALKGNRVCAVAWCAGLAASIATMAVVPGLLLRVDLGFVIGSAVATAIMAVGVMRRRSLIGTTGIESLIAAIEHEPIEI
jgi:O-antigen/teichoic acid export membrane protein